MTKRLETILLNLEKCRVFADVGCDHGYVAKGMLDADKCEKAIVSDVSEKCLNKAKDLLKEEISQGRAQAIVSNGLEKLPPIDLVLIAGMGGEEIISILSSAVILPDKLVLQPMKNVDKVRLFLTATGYKINKDFCFEDGGKFYDLLVIDKGEQTLTDEQILLGKTNLEEKSADFLERNRQEIKRIDKILSTGKIDFETQKKLQKKQEVLKKYV